MSTDITHVAFENAKLSARGAIRQAHDVPTWLSKLALLQSKGLKADAVIKAWNDVATRDSQITGQKRVALLQLLASPLELCQLLIKHASEFGQKGAFSEECFANKALQVGASLWSGKRG